MKLFKVITLIVGLLLLPLSSYSFLTDNDPLYFFDLVAKAPLVIRGKVSQVMPAEKGRAYFIYEVQNEEVLSGVLKDKNIKIFQESVFPGEKAAMVSESQVMLFLAPMPKYTAYQKAIQEGARYRLFGGASGVWKLAGKGNTLKLVQEIIRAKQAGGISPTKRKSLLLSLLTSPEKKIREAGAMGLGAADLNSGSLSSEEEQQIYQTILAASLGKKAEVALIEALKDSRSVAILKKIANETKGTPKWAAVRALKELGHPRSVQELAKDYERGNVEEKKRAMGMMAQRQDAAAQKFLNQLIQSTVDYEVKRATIVKMGEVGGKGNEQVLLGNVNHPEEQVGAQVLLSLGNMNSRASVPQILQLLESDSKLLRDAAILSLYRNKDPQAMKYFQERYVKDPHGHFHPKRHFSDVPGAAPRPPDDPSHSDHQH